MAARTIQKLAFSAILTSSLAGAFTGCSSESTSLGPTPPTSQNETSHQSEEPKPEPRSRLSTSCEAPISISGLVAGVPVPRDSKGLLPLSGDLGERVPEGGFGVVRTNTGWELAANVAGRSVVVPNSEGVIQIAAEELPGTNLKLLAFARTHLSERGSFAGKDVYEVDRKTWTLEIVLVDPQGQVSARTTLSRPGHSVVPFDIAVDENVPGVAQVFIQWDRRGIVDTRVRGDETTTPQFMQIVEVNLSGKSDLSVSEGPLETMTAKDMKTLLSDYIDDPECTDEVDLCGPIPQKSGAYKDCGGCSGGKVCAGNRCHDPGDLPNGQCTPATRAELCKSLSCGTRYDGCGGVVDCGGCAQGLVCDDADSTGTCVDPLRIQPDDVRSVFGPSVCGCFTNDSGSVTSITCPDGQRCENNVCVGTPTANSNPDAGN